MSTHRLLLSIYLLSLLLLLAVPDLAAQESGAGHEERISVPLPEPSGPSPSTNTTASTSGSGVPWILIGTGMVMLASAGMLIHRYQEE